MRIDDRLFGLFFVLLGVATILAARRLSSVPGTTYGPDIMPILIGIGMIGFGLKIAWTGFTTYSRSPWLDVTAWKGRTRGCLAAIWTILGIAAAIPFLSKLGLPLYGLLFCLPLVILTRARLWIAIPSVLATILIAQFVFGEMLHVPLPEGLIPLPW